MDKQNTMHFYSERQTEWKNEKHTRKVAFAGIIRDNKLIIGKAECGNNDIFNKKLGRTIAEGRAAKKPILTVNIPENTKKLGDLFINTCKDLLKE